MLQLTCDCLRKHMVKSICVSGNCYLQLCLTFQKIIKIETAYSTSCWRPNYIYSCREQVTYIASVKNNLLLKLKYRIMIKNVTNTPFPQEADLRMYPETTILYSFHFIFVHAFCKTWKIQCSTTYGMMKQLYSSKKICWMSIALFLFRWMGKLYS